MLKVMKNPNKSEWMDEWRKKNEKDRKKME